MCHKFVDKCVTVTIVCTRTLMCFRVAKNNAIQLLATDLKEHNPQLVLVSETWFTVKHDDSILAIDNYTLYRRDRVKRKGGGVCVYARNDVNCELFPCHTSCDKVEILWLKCCFNNQYYYINCLLLLPPESPIRSSSFPRRPYQ